MSNESSFSFIVDLFILKLTPGGELASSSSSITKFNSSEPIISPFSICDTFNLIFSKPSSITS